MWKESIGTMKIAEIKAIPIGAEMHRDRPYWGTGFWGEKPEMHPGRPIGAGGSIYTEYPPLWRNRCVYSKLVETTLVRITTDTGLVGWGECHAPVASEIYREVIDRILAPLLLAADPLRPKALWEEMYSAMRLRGNNQGFMMECIAGVDIALWDLAGKALGVPIHVLLGGSYRDMVKVYGSSIPAVHAEAGEDGWRDLADLARDTVTRGFQAMKIKVGLNMKRDVRAVKAVREAVGEDVLIMVDAGGSYDVAMAKAVCRQLDGLNILFIEEPVPPELIDSYVEIRRAVDIRVAGGECLCNRFAVNEFLRRGALDVIQPDISRSGGFTETLRIAELADVHGVAVQPHVSIGSAIYQAASLQLAAAIPNLLIMELWMGDNPLGNAILKDPLVLRDGYLQVPQTPGLGIEVDENELMQYTK